MGYRHQMPEPGDETTVGTAMSNAACDLAEALGARDAVHRLHRLDRVVAGGGLGRQHHGGGAVEDGIRNVARLGASRLRVLDHRLEHLGRSDHRLPGLEAAQDDPLLEQRHGRCADLDSEVTARDHDRVGLAQHFVEHLDRLGLLDLRDHACRRPVLSDDLVQIADVGRRAHEREGDVVDVERQRELEIVEILRRQRGNRDRDPRQIHALVRLDLAANEHPAAGAPVRNLLDAEPDEPVVDQHLVAGLQHVPDYRRRDRQLAVARRLLRTDLDLVARVEDDRLGQLADAQLRPLQVGDERDRAADIGRDLAHEPGTLGVPFVRAVREVEADRVDARLNQCAQALARFGRRSERCHDLRLAFAGQAGVQTSSAGRARR